MASRVLFGLLIYILQVRFKTVAEDGYLCYDLFSILTGRLIAFQHQLEELETGFEARLLRKIDRLNTAVQTLGTKLEEAKTANEEVNRTVTNLEGQNKILSTTIQKSLTLENNHTTVFFKAQLSESNITLEPDQRLRLNIVVESLGNGYNVSTGIFTAPCKGIDLFAVTALSSHNGHARLSIVKNDTVLLGRFYTGIGGRYNAGSEF